MPWLNAPGTVTVTDGTTGLAVANATVTILGPLPPQMDPDGNLRFDQLFLSPMSGLTDANGEFSFDGMEATTIPFNTSVEFAFVVSATLGGQAITETVSETIDVMGAGAPPPPPGLPTLSPQDRLPLGAGPFTPDQKAHFASAGADLVKSGVLGSIKGTLFTSFELFALTPVPGGAVLLMATAVYDATSIISFYAGQTLLVLAQDPPDPDFAVVALPVLPPGTPPLTPGEDLSPAIAGLVNEMGASSRFVAAYLEALKTSVDRYNTALDAGDLQSAALQRNAILAYQDALALLFARNAEVIDSLLAQAQSEGIPNYEFTEAVVIAALDADFFLPLFTEYLSNRGLSDSEIQEIQGLIANAPPADLAGDVFSALQEGADASRVAAAAFVPDNQPPEINCGDPVVLWSPNHELVDVSSAITVEDPDGDEVTLSFRVISDESETPETGDGTGRHAPDFKTQLASGEEGLYVRSERRGPEDGRFYIFVVTADDGNGGVTTAVCDAAVVPHDEGNESLNDVVAQAANAASVIQAAVDAGDPLPPPGFYEHGLSDPLGPKQ